LGCNLGFKDCKCSLQWPREDSGALVTRAGKQIRESMDQAGSSTGLHESI
jgi:hypothetical protein